MKDPITAEYDVIVEQSPTSPNMKTESWVALRDVMPVLQAAGMQPPKEIIDILPLPEVMKEKWKESIKAGPPPEVQQKMQEMDGVIQQLQQENQQLQSKSQTEAMKIQSEHEHKMHELSMRQQQFEAEMAQKAQEIQAKSQLEMMKIQSDMQIKQSQMESDIQMAREKAVAELSLKQEVAGAEIGLKQEESRMKYSGEELNELKSGRESMKQELIEAMSEEINKSNQQMMEFVSKSIIESVKVIAEQMNKPKVLVFD
jgi:hypothetical protein